MYTGMYSVSWVLYDLLLQVERDVLSKLGAIKS